MKDEGSYITPDGDHIQKMTCGCGKRADYFSSAQTQWYCKDCIKEVSGLSERQWRKMKKGEYDR